MPSHQIETLALDAHRLILKVNLNSQSVMTGVLESLPHTHLKGYQKEEEEKADGTVGSHNGNTLFLFLEIPPPGESLSWTHVRMFLTSMWLSKKLILSRREIQQKYPAHATFDYKTKVKYIPWWKISRKSKTHQCSQDTVDHVLDITEQLEKEWTLPAIGEHVWLVPSRSVSNDDNICNFE